MKCLKSIMSFIMILSLTACDTLEDHSLKGQAKYKTNLLTLIHQVINSNQNDQNQDEQEIVDQPVIQTKVLLDLKQVAQENGYYCVPACMQMVLNYRGIEITQTELANEMNTSSITGTEYEDLARIANRTIFGYDEPEDNQGGYRLQRLSAEDDLEEVSQLFQARVIQDMSTQDPLFAAIDLHAVYPELPSANHMVLVVGSILDEDTQQITKYYFIDPYYKVWDEVYDGLKIIDADEMIQAMILNEEPAYVW